MPVSPRRLVDEAPLSRAQIFAIAITMAISALDGYDVLSVTFAAPGIVTEFGIDKPALGLLLSMGLVGMALGSLLLAPLADRFGRRALVLASLMLMAIGMFASAAAGSITAFSAWRVLTGCGIGAMVAVINPLAAEYANERRRELAVGLMAVGYPIGGTVGGALAASLLHSHGWREVFLLGGAGALILLPVAFLGLPESIGYLERRRPPGGLRQINAILRRWGHSEIAELPPQTVVPQAAPLLQLLSGPLLRRTLIITAVNFLFVIAVYYLLSWLPQMVVDSGFSPASATRVSVAANLAGVAGGLLLGWLAPRLGLKIVTIAAFAGMGLFTVAFGRVPADYPMLLATAAMAGFCLFGGIVGIYSVIARAFPVEARATGAGFVIGVGRGGSALAPVIAGILLGAGAGRDGVSLAMGGCAILAALLLTGLQLPSEMSEAEVGDERSRQS